MPLFRRLLLRLLLLRQLNQRNSQRAATAIHAAVRVRAIRTLRTTNTARTIVAQAENEIVARAVIRAVDSDRAVVRDTVNSTRTSTHTREAIAVGRAALMAIAHRARPARTARTIDSRRTCAVRAIRAEDRAADTTRVRPVETRMACTVVVRAAATIRAAATVRAGGLAAAEDRVPVMASQTDRARAVAPHRVIVDTAARAHWAIIRTIKPLTLTVCCNC